jgi:hypothetical protein
VPDVIETVDFAHVCCGLVPAMLAHLAQTRAQTVVFRIRSGMGAEIASGFGTGVGWTLRLEPGVGCDLARFTRRAASGRGKLDLLGG